MEKYLEALKIIKIKCHPNSNPSPIVDEALLIIEQAIQRLVAIDNANPSEALDRLSASCNINYWNSNDYIVDVNSIKQALIKSQELAKQVGCPLEIREQALKQCEFEGLYFETTDTDGFERVGIYKCCLCYDGFNNKFYWNCGWNAETWLNCYKKTWWLKADKSE